MTLNEWLHDPAGFASTLPAGFEVGVSTAAFQIEGAVREGGRGPSTWDEFMAQPGRIGDGSDASVAADHYHRYREDVGLLRELGVDSYRFSLGWSRVQARFIKAGMSRCSHCPTRPHPRSRTRARLRHPLRCRSCRYSARPAGKRATRNYSPCRRA